MIISIKATNLGYMWYLDIYYCAKHSLEGSQTRLCRDLLKLRQILNVKLIGLGFRMV